MLKLDEYEKKLLLGEQGEIKKKAMENICKYAEVLGVDELCEVTMSTVFVGAHSYLKAAGVEEPAENFAIMNMVSKEGMDLSSIYPECMCQTCAEPLDADNYRSVALTDADHQKNEDYVHYVTKAGVVRAASCTPYLTGWIPLRGQHFVSTESSNVVLCNSLFGACANPEGIESCFWATICGRIPKYGKHDPKNRFGTCIVQLDFPIETATEWDLLGYVLGKMLPKASAPVLVGDFVKPNIYKFKQFCASLAIVSDIDLFHVVGITPEADTIESAFGGKVSEQVFHVGKEDLSVARKAICAQLSGKVDFVNLGCPHYSIYEIQKAAEYLKGKSVAEGVKLMLWTSYSIKSLADRCGYTDVIHDAGGDLYAGSCPYYLFENPDTKKLLLGDRNGAVFDSVKMAYGMPMYYEAEMKTYYGEQEKCLQSAIDGYWR